MPVNGNPQIIRPRPTNNRTSMTSPQTSTICILMKVYIYNERIHCTTAECNHSWSYIPWAGLHQGSTKYKNAHNKNCNLELTFSHFWPQRSILPVLPVPQIARGCVLLLTFKANSCYRHMMASWTQQQHVDGGIEGYRSSRGLQSHDRKLPAGCQAALLFRQKVTLLCPLCLSTFASRLISIPDVHSKTHFLSLWIAPFFLWTLLTSIFKLFIYLFIYFTDWP